MLRTKVFEVRDKGTCLGVLATQLLACSSREEWLIHRKCGHPVSFSSPNIMLTNLDSGGKSFCSEYDWGDRTYQIAHKYISENFTTLDDGAVVDVEFILGETDKPKTSDRYFNISKEM